MNVRRFLPSLACALAACAQPPLPEPSIGATVASAAVRHDVPASLLLAAGHVETRWRLPDPDEDGAHGAQAATRLGLRVDQRAAIAPYASDPDGLAIDDAAAIDAFAAALSAARRDLGIPADAPVIDWLPALARLGAPDDPIVGASWATEVLRAVARGFVDESDTGEIVALAGGEVSPEEVDALANDVQGFLVPGTDSVEADRWLAARAGHWSAGRGGVAIDRIIIHTIEGSYDSAIAWFRSSANPYLTSAHYVVRDVDGHITQMVREADTAHHIGGYNSRSIGIEHEGYAGQGGFSDAMYRASAKLVRDICIRRGIPMDRTHIVGHVEVPGATHWDPGPYWDWQRFMNYVKQAPATAAPAVSTRVPGDVNGDGRADLVTLHSNGTAYVYKGTTAGGFAGAVSSFAGTMGDGLFDGTGHVALGTADVNGDGRADLVTAHTNGTVYTYKGAADATLGARVESFAGTFGTGIHDGVGHLPAGLGDVTGDGRADLVTVHTNGNAYVYPGRSDGTFGAYASSFSGTMADSITGTSGHWPVGVADVDGDGRADLVTVHTNGNAYVYPGRADGTFGGATSTFAGTLNTALTDGIGHEHAALADVTGDGRADLVTLKSGTAYVYPGRSDRKFGGSTASFAGTMGSALFDGVGFEVVGALDVDGDGHADLVTLHSNGNGYVYFGDADATLGPRVDLFNGTMDSAAHDGVGHQAVSEPWWRRRGCDADGCR